MGLIGRIFPHDGLLRRRDRDRAGNRRGTGRLHRPYQSLLNLSQNDSLEAFLLREETAQAVVFGTEDFAEGNLAFRESASRTSEEGDDAFGDVTPAVEPAFAAAGSASADRGSSSLSSWCDLCVSPSAMPAVSAISARVRQWRLAEPISVMAAFSSEACPGLDPGWIPVRVGKR